MVDRSTRCISQVFGFLKDIEHCENCDISPGSDFGESSSSASTSQLLKKSLSDTKLFKSPIQNQPQVVRKCVCHLSKLKNLDVGEEPIHADQNCTKENEITGTSNTDSVNENGENGEMCRCDQETAGNDEDESENPETRNTEIEDAGRNVPGEMNLENQCNGMNGSEALEDEDIQMRHKVGETGANERSNTQVVSEMFRFLNTDSIVVNDEKLQSELHIQQISLLVEKEEQQSIKNTELKEQNCTDECSSSLIHSAENVYSENNQITNCRTDDKTLESSDQGLVKTVDNVDVEHSNTDATQTELDTDETSSLVVRNVNCVSADEVVNVGDSQDNSKETVCKTVVSEKLMNSPKTKCPDDVFGGQASSSGDEVVRRRRPSSRRSETDDHSDDSSDEDTGIYAESYRNSTWIKVDDDGDICAGKSASLPTRKTTDTDVDVRASSASMSDDVFTEGRGSPMVRTHKRSDSSTTTLSETEFKRQYTTRRKCLIQRDDSQQEYHRFSAKFYDQEKVVVVQKDENEVDQDFGLHIIDYQPAYITSVDAGSPAARAGLQEGQILIAVNGVNVLEATHDEIVTIMQQDPSMIKLEVAYSDFQPVRDLQARVMSGYMYKLGNSTLMKTWKKRYFVLRQDNCLYYYKTGQEQIPLGAVPLAGYSISRFIDTNRDYCFKADKYGARSYFFMTDSRDDMTEWVGKLTEAATRSKKRKDSWLDVSSHNVGLPALEIRRPESTGYLTKMGRQRKVWKKRYCVLKDACIYYYKLMSSHSAQGVAHLHGYEVDTVGIPGKRHSFILKPPEPSMRTFYFCAENETDKARWVDAMTRSIQRWVKVDNK